MANTITIKIKNKSKFQRFVTWLKGQDYIEVVNKDKNRGPVRSNSQDDFFALAGLWEKRNISAEGLRSKAWRKVK